MSHQNLAEAFMEHEARYAAQVMHDTWGHLEPEPRKEYEGSMVFTLGSYGDYTPISADFKDLPDSPGFFADMMNFVTDKATEHGAIYKFTGKYMRFKNGGFRFSGKTVKVTV